MYDGVHCNTLEHKLTMLKFQCEIIDQMEGDGLLILAKGLSLHIILSAFISIHSTSKNLVLLLNTPSREALLLQNIVLNSQKFIILDNTTASKSR